MWRFCVFVGKGEVFGFFVLLAFFVGFWGG